MNSSNPSANWPDPRKKIDPKPQPKLFRTAAETEKFLADRQVRENAEEQVWIKTSDLSSHSLELMAVSA